MSDDTLAQQYGYLDACAAGGLLFCSGQIGLDAHGKVPADAATQYERAFAAVGALLQRHGLAAADIVDLTSFHVDYPQHMDAFMRSKAAFMGKASSCWTAIGVAALGYPGQLVELKVVARLRDAAASRTSGLTMP